MQKTRRLATVEVELSELRLEKQRTKVMQMAKESEDLRTAVSSNICSSRNIANESLCIVFKYSKIFKKYNIVFFVSYTEVSNARR